MMWALFWTLRYALNIVDEDEEEYYDPKRLGPTPADLVLIRELHNEKIPVDMNRMLAHIVALSPPHALVDKGYSASYKR